MNYKVIIVNTLGMSNQQVLAALEAQLNMYGAEGFHYSDSFLAGNQWLYVIMSRSTEKKVGRPRKDADGEASLMPE